MPKRRRRRVRRALDGLRSYSRLNVVRLAEAGRLEILSAWREGLRGLRVHMNSWNREAGGVILMREDFFSPTGWACIDPRGVITLYLGGGRYYEFSVQAK